jgi:hypothetical protein
MPFGSFERDPQRVSDLLVAATLRQQVQHFALPRR